MISSAGKTPDMTLNSAIGTEIRKREKNETKLVEIGGVADADDVY